MLFRRFGTCFDLLLFGRKGPERGDFNDLVVEVDVGETEPSTDKSTVSEDLFDLMGSGIGGNIEILGFPAKQQVAHPTANKVCMIPFFLQAVEHPECVGTDPLAGEGMFRSWNDGWLYAHKRILTHMEGEGKEERIIKRNE